MPPKTRKPAAAKPKVPDDRKAGNGGPPSSASIAAADVAPGVDEQSPPFPIVAVGASAGGIEAFQRLLAALPSNTGMAFVMIMHLDPRHASELATILARSTDMPVREVKDGMAIEPDQVYVIPPAKNMVVDQGRLQLSPRTEIRGVHHPIDHFMRSLGESHGEKAIGIVLSGTGSDGTLGLQEIKSGGGITFAQDDSATQKQMPREAVAAGAVDHELTPERIAEELSHIGRHPLLRPAHKPRREAEMRRDLGRIVELVQQETGMDFTNYRHKTLERRITRRMLLHKLPRMSEYTTLLRENPQEVQTLYQDFLISVTSFFRDPSAFEMLKTLVFPALTQGRSRNENVRVWVLGCSTGEEAYSIAMAYTEYLEQSGRRTPMQVLASDVNAVGIEKARAGIYPKGIEQDVSAERLRFFDEVDGAYRIVKPIRDMCIFARHNSLTDPPFSHVDLVSCRNLLIYLEPVLQKKLMPLMHYALRPNGFLWLGNSESANAYPEMFEPRDAKHRFYSRRPGSHNRATIRAPLESRESARRVPFERPAGYEHDPQKDAERLLLARYVPAGVVLDNDLNIVQFRGDTSPYLVPPQGRASLNVFKMLREGLMVGVRGALHRSAHKMETVRVQGLRVRTEAGNRRVDIVAMPIVTDGKPSGTALLFEQPGEGAAAQARQRTTETRARKRAGEKPETADQEAQRLRQELTATRDYLQSVIEELEATNEELQSTNEEAQSANEELQSVNEELETSKEEIQSANEELSTVNEELQNRNNELAQTSADFANLLANVDVPVVMLDTDLRIRRFTPAAEQLFSFRPTDIGRPLTEINLNLVSEDIDGILAGVLRDGTVFEREVQDRQGHWYWLRVRPYRTYGNQVQGALVVLVDVDALKRSSERVRESEGRFEALADSAPVLIWVHGLDGCKFVNRAYEKFAGVPAARLMGQRWTRLLHPEDRESYVEDYIAACERGSDFERIARFRRADGAYRWMKSVGVPRRGEDGQLIGYVGSSTDITELKDAEEGLREADRAKDEFLGTIGHELRNPLAAISNASYILTNAEGRGWKTGLGIIERQTRNMVRIVDDLLDVARITHGKITLRMHAVEVESVVRDAVSATEHDRVPSKQTLTVSTPPDPVWVRADPARFEQILVNLLGNASKFTPVNGHIWLDVTREGTGDSAKAVIRVRDNGPGIDPQVLPRIFDLFVQGGRPDDRARTGVGIGLSLARQLVELHGGTIEAYNLPERGSEFVVTMPAAPPAEPMPADEGPAAPRAGARRVLVVDDNHDAAQALEMLLASEGHEVRVAGDGETALALAREFDPEVVILDIGLPDMDGYSVGKRLRAESGNANLRLVALTGYGRKEDISAAYKAGFDEHLVKPADQLTLLEVITRPGGALRAPGT